MKSVSLVRCALMFSTFAACAPTSPALVFHPPAGAKGPTPYSEAVQVGDLLFLAGKLGRAPGAKSLAPGGIQGETRQALENIKAVLERHGSSMDRVFKCTVFLADIAEWAAMNEVYIRYFPSNPPARSAVGVGSIALNARVEIECIALVGAKP